MTCGREGPGCGGANLCVKVFGTIWTRGIACVHAQLSRIGTPQGNVGRTASSFFLPLEEGAGGGIK